MFTLLAKGVTSRLREHYVFELIVHRLYHCKPIVLVHWNHFVDVR